MPKPDPSHNAPYAEDLDELEPDCETAGNPFHRHTPHCFGVDDPIRGEL